MYNNKKCSDKGEVISRVSREKASPAESAFK